MLIHDIRNDPSAFAAAVEKESKKMLNVASHNTKHIATALDIAKKAKTSVKDINKQINAASKCKQLSFISQTNHFIHLQLTGLPYHLHHRHIIIYI